MACMAPTKPPSSGEAMSSLCNCRMEHSNKSFGTLRLTLVSASAISKVSKLLLECSMPHLHNELIASPYDGGLVGAIHAIKNDVIISDTMLRSLAPPQLRPMTDNHKMMCGCAICNTSKYMQETLNKWRQKQLKIMKEKPENSRGRGKDELTQA